MIFNKNQKNTGDGIDLLRSIDSASVALVMFDPQYREVLESLKYGNEGARQKRRAALPQMSPEVIASFAVEIERILRPSGHLALWVDKFILVERLWANWLPPGLKPVDHLTWRKPRMGMGYRTRRKSEHLLIFQKPPIRAKGVWLVHDIPDVLDGVSDTASHPHSKPIDIQRRIIGATTLPNDIVVDPSAGGYSAMEAALSCGRQFLGCDILEI